MTFLTPDQQCQSTEGELASVTEQTENEQNEIYRSNSELNAQVKVI